MAGNPAVRVAPCPTDGLNSHDPNAAQSSLGGRGSVRRRQRILSAPAAVVSWVFSQIFKGLGLGRILSLGRTVPAVPPPEDDAPKTPTLKGQVSKVWDESSDTTQECGDWSTPSYSTQEHGPWSSPSAESTPSGLSICIELDTNHEIKNITEEDGEIAGVDEDEDEPLLQEEGNHFCMFPLRYPQIWDLYKIALGNFWTVEDVDLSRDSGDWRLLSGTEKAFVKMALSILGGSDAPLLENVALRFMTDVMAPEARAFYGFQIAMENVHTELYSKLQQHYIEDPSERAKMSLAIQTASSAQNKASWELKLVNSGDSFANRLVAFACIQSLHFTRNFFTLWLKSRDLMPALTGASELVARDRGLHAHFTCLLYNLLDNRLTDHTVHKIVKQAVELEKEFCVEVLNVAMAGLDTGTVSEYLEFAADRLLTDLGHQKLYLTHNPFSETVGPTEFNALEYSNNKQGGVTSSPGYSRSNYVLTYDADF